MNIRTTFNPAVWIVLITLLSTDASAQKKFILTPVEHVKAVNLFVELEDDMPYTVSLKDAEGHILWSTLSRERVFAKSILVDQLPLGTYQVLVASEEAYYQNSFTTTEDAVAISRDKSSIVGPTVSVMNRSVLVDFDYAGDAQDVSVTIYDARGKEVFANAITTDDRRITSYDMSLLPAGSYELLFKIRDKNFVRRVRIR